MSPQLEAVLMVSAAGCTACAGIVTWAAVVTARSRGNRATAASNLATRITDETNRRQLPARPQATSHARRDGQRRGAH